MVKQLEVSLPASGTTQINSRRRLAIALGFDVVVMAVLSIGLVWLGLTEGWDALGEGHRGPVLPYILLASLTWFGSSLVQTVTWLRSSHDTNLGYDGQSLLVNGARVEASEVTATKSHSLLSASGLWSAYSLHVGVGQTLRFAFASSAARTEFLSYLHDYQSEASARSGPWPSLPIEVMIAEGSLPDFGYEGADGSVSFGLTKSLRPPLTTKTVSIVSGFSFFILAAASANLFVGVIAGAVGSVLAMRFYSGERFEMLVAGDLMWIKRTTGKREVVPLQNLNKLESLDSAGWRLNYMDEQRSRRTMIFNVGRRQNRLFATQLARRCTWIEVIG